MDLSLVSLDELVSEIEKRTTSFIVGYLRPENDKVEVACFRFHGSKFMAIGLARSMEKKILNDVNKTEDV